MDWYLNLKTDFLKLVIAATNFRSDLFNTIYNNPNILFDINMDKRFNHLVDSENLLCKYIDDFKDELNYLEETGWSFSREDLLDEFSFIQSIFHFEIIYYRKLLEYLNVIDNYSIQKEEDINTFLEKNTETSDFCYQKIRENHQDLKRLKRERRNDYFE